MSDPPVQRPHSEPTLLEEARSELARWKDMGAVEQMREDADGWVFLVERFEEQVQTLQAAVEEGWEWKGEAGRLKEQLAAAQTRWRLMLDAREEESNRAERAEERLEAMRDALIGTGWRDADGLCWCQESVEITGNPHQPKCIAARQVLDGSNPATSSGALSEQARDTVSRGAPPEPSPAGSPVTDADIDHDIGIDRPWR